MDELITHIKSLENKKPGVEAQLIMAPYRKTQLKNLKVNELKSKKAAVQILLYPKNNTPHFALMKRPVYNGHHSGQISLPGGRLEKSDLNLEYTAKRETFEEIGIPENHIKNLYSLSDLFIPPSNFFVSPFLGYIDYTPRFIKDPVEVAEILEVPLTNLLDENRVKNKKIKHSSNISVDTPYFELNNEIVWGATAMILSEFKQLLLTLENIQDHL